MRGARLAERSALSRTIAKLEAAAGEAGVPSAQVAVQVDKIAQQAVLTQLQDALARGRRVHLSYYVPGRDEATERDVDPMRLLVVEGRTYLEGWCRRAEAVRLFRLDRVLGLRVLDQPAEVPAEAEPKDVDQGLFRPVAGGPAGGDRAGPARPLGGRVLPVRGRGGAGRRPAAGQTAHSGQPLGPAAGAAAGRERPGHRARATSPPRSGRMQPPHLPSTLDRFTMTGPGELPGWLNRHR